VDIAGLTAAQMEAVRRHWTVLAPEARTLAAGQRAREQAATRTQAARPAGIDPARMPPGPDIQSAAAPSPAQILTTALARAADTTNTVEVAQALREAAIAAAALERQSPSALTAAIDSLPHPCVQVLATVQETTDPAASWPQRLRVAACDSLADATPTAIEAAKVPDALRRLAIDVQARTRAVDILLAGLNTAAPTDPVAHFIAANRLIATNDAAADHLVLTEPEAAIHALDLADLLAGTARTAARECLASCAILRRLDPATLAALHAAVEVCDVAADPEHEPAVWEEDWEMGD
jgi:hypothetical protein